MTGRTIAGWILAAVALAAALAYLRDPPWLLNVTSGLTGWQTDPDGTRYRWTRGRASFFIPADAGELILRLRSIKDMPGDWPVTATISLDGRPADAVRFEDERWRTVRLRLPLPGSRAVRRVDIHLDRLRSGQRGIQLSVVLRAAEHTSKDKPLSRGIRLASSAVERLWP